MLKRTSSGILKVLDPGKEEAAVDCKEEPADDCKEEPIDDAVTWDAYGGEAPGVPGEEAADEASPRDIYIGKLTD